VKSAHRVERTSPTQAVSLAICLEQFVEIVQNGFTFPACEQQRHQRLTEAGRLRLNRRRRGLDARFACCGQRRIAYRHLAVVRMCARRVHP
jgi:hypothetical protein